MNTIVINQNKTNVRIISPTLCYTFGLEINDIYERCDCPIDYLDKYADDVWIKTTNNLEPIRCLYGEYLIL
jgi:hypothetical protein